MYTFTCPNKNWKTSTEQQQLNRDCLPQVIMIEVEQAHLSRPCRSNKIRVWPFAMLESIASNNKAILPPHPDCRLFASEQKLSTNVMAEAHCSREPSKEILKTKSEVLSSFLQLARPKCTTKQILRPTEARSPGEPIKGILKWGTLPCQILFKQVVNKLAPRVAKFAGTSFCVGQTCSRCCK